MDSAEEFISYISSVRRYSPRTCAIYADVLRRFREYCAPGIAEATGIADAAGIADASNTAAAPSPESSPLKIENLLNPENIRSYEVYLMDTLRLNARTVNLHLSVLSSWCRFLIKKGGLKTNSASLIKRPRQEKRLPEFYRNESIRNYFDTHRGTLQYAPYGQQLDYMIISLLEGTAIRRSELIALNNSSIDHKRRVLHVRGKGDKMREIPIVASLFEEISLYLQSKLTNGKCSAEPDAPLLQTASGGRLYPVFVDRAVKRELGTVASITGRRSPHVLRHTLATELLDNGADLNSIKEFLGHSSLAATQVYTHISVEKLKNIYKNAHPRAKNGGKNGNQSEDSEI